MVETKFGPLKNTPDKPIQNLAERMAKAAGEVAREKIDAPPLLRLPRLGMQREDLTHDTTTPESPNIIRAAFLPSAKEFFTKCGLDPARIDPIPLGEGLTHLVYKYASPEGQAQVIKISKPESMGLMSKGRRDESENITLIKKYFSNFAVPTEIRSDPSTGKYLILQQAVEGQPITNKSQTPEILAQLKELMVANARLMKETGHSMDFVGVPGFLSWVRHQFRQFFTHKSVFEISNLILDPGGKIRIIDYDMLRFRNISTKQKLVSWMGYTTNQFLMKAYFGLDMKPKTEKI